MFGMILTVVDQRSALIFIEGEIYVCHTVPQLEIMK